MAASCASRAHRQAQQQPRAARQLPLPRRRRAQQLWAATVRQQEPAATVRQQAQAAQAQALTPKPTAPVPQSAQSLPLCSRLQGPRQLRCCTAATAVTAAARGTSRARIFGGSTSSSGAAAAAAAVRLQAAAAPAPFNPKRFEEVLWGAGHALPTQGCNIAQSRMPHNILIVSQTHERIAKLKSSAGQAGPPASATNTTAQWSGKHAAQRRGESRHLSPPGSEWELQALASGVTSVQDGGCAAGRLPAHTRVICAARRPSSHDWRCMAPGAADASRGCLTVIMYRHHLQRGIT